MMTTMLLFITLLSFRLGSFKCLKKKDTCTLDCENRSSGKQKCDSGNYTCNMKCNKGNFKQICQAKVCNLEGSGKLCNQSCQQEGETCNMKCNGKWCNQLSERIGNCTMLCSGKNCTQKCNMEGKSCNMDCKTENCSQTCDGKENCTILCNGTNCTQFCEERGKSCNMVCKGGNCIQRCNRKGNCTMECSGKKCDQFCNKQAQRCAMNCRGEECNQHCNSKKGCFMQCSGENCTQRVNNQIERCSKQCNGSTCEQIYNTSKCNMKGYGPSPLLLSSSSSLSPTTESPLSISEVVENMANDSVSKLSRIEISKNSSLKDAVRIFEDFTDQYRNITRLQSQPYEKEAKANRKSIFQVTVALEKFSLNYGKYHLGGTKPFAKIKSQKIVLGIQIGYRQNARDFLLEEEEGQASINISSGNFADNGTLVVGCVYKDLQQLLMAEETATGETYNSRYVNTRIMMAAMDPKPEQLQQNVILKFRNLKVVEEEKHCMFWIGSSKSPDGFSGDGCHIDASNSNSFETVCSCSHLTHFAVLVDYSGDAKLPIQDITILEIITYVGLSLSIIGMLSTFILYSILTDVRQPLSQIRLSLSVALGAGQIIFLAGIQATEKTAVCVTVAALMQYFMMAAFCWMLVEGIYLYLFVVKVYNINTKMYMYHIISWALPVVMVGISLSIAAGKDGIQSFVSDKYCWMPSENNLIWIFVTFFVTVELINILLLARVVREMTKMQPTGDKRTQQIQLGIKACVVMVPLLGVTWLFGILSPLHKAFAYIFTILNSTQGFLIFLLHCVRNSQIRERFKRKVNIIFPSTDKRNSARKSSKVNPSDVGDVWAVKLQSYKESELKNKTLS